MISDTRKEPSLNIKRYSREEERLNILSHGLGLVLSVLACILLVVHAVSHGTVWHIFSFSIFGLSLVTLYAVSTCYHSATNLEFRIKMKIMDHSAIYVLIAGSYTPFALVTLKGSIGWTIFLTTWGMAAIGITLKIFFTGRYSLVSTIMYVLMGWVIVFAIKPLLASFPLQGFYWLVASGLTYTLGAVIYSIKTIKMNHAIFHVFVMIGSFCHFVSVYFYVLP
jgi:hemolysin III